MRILLAEAELELVPDAIAGHPAVRKYAGKNRPLLDANLHGPAMRPLEGAERRGRPDIVHTSLLYLLESPLALAGGLDVAIHTRDGHLLRIRPGTRLPRGEQRFAGLMAKVLAEGRSQDKDPLIWKETTCPPAAALAAYAQGPVTRLDEAAPRRTARELDGTLIIGAFPHGAWSQEWHEAAPTTASIHDAPLNAWVVAAECVAGRV